MKASEAKRIVSIVQSGNPQLAVIELLEAAEAAQREAFAAGRELNIEATKKLNLPFPRWRDFDQWQKERGDEG